MYRWSKIPEEHRPKIISDISDEKFYTLKVQDWKFKKIKRKDACACAAARAATAARRIRGGGRAKAAAFGAWEGHYLYEGAFKNIIDKNIPCTLMHKVKNNWAPEIDTVVYFMTGDTLDVFLVHPKDLTKWDPNDA